MKCVIAILWFLNLKTCSAIKHHPEEKRVIESACDAIRCLCSLESNRDRLGNAGACEAMVGALASFSNSNSNVEVNISFLLRSNLAFMKYSFYYEK